MLQGAALRSKSESLSFFAQFVESCLKPDHFARPAASELLASLKQFEAGFL